MVAILDLTSRELGCLRRVAKSPNKELPFETYQGNHEGEDVALALVAAGCLHLETEGPKGFLVLSSLGECVLRNGSASDGTHLVQTPLALQGRSYMSISEPQYKVLEKIERGESLTSEDVLASSGLHAKKYVYKGALTQLGKYILRLEPVWKSTHSSGKVYRYFYFQVTKALIIFSNQMVGIR